MKRFFALLLSVMILLPAVTALAADPVSIQSITLDVTEASVPLNRKVTLRATIDPRNASSKKLDWTSSDESVVKVENGQVSGVSLGTATVTAAAKDGSGVTASAVITVVNPVTKIEPESKQLTLPPDVTWEMLWSVEPEDATNRTVIWTSNNEDVATVNENGVIFTHKNGYCSITGSAADGSGEKAVVNLTVRDHEIVIVHPGQVDVDFETEDTTITETKTVNGKETTVKTNRYFRTDNGCVISLDDMVLLPVKAGSDTISIQYIQKKKTAKIEKHTVFVARSAVGETAEYTEDSSVKPIRFLGLAWGYSYPKIKTVLEFRGRHVKNIVRSNDNLRSMLEGEVLFGSLTAFSAALNFSYDQSSRSYETNNSLFSGDLYFDPSIPFQDIVKTVKNIYSLEEGEESKKSCSWERDHVRVVLTKAERYTLLELIWDGEPIPLNEEDWDYEIWSGNVVTDAAEDGDEEPESDEPGTMEPAVLESGGEGPDADGPWADSGTDTEGEWTDTEGPGAGSSGNDGPEGPWDEN